MNNPMTQFSVAALFAVGSVGLLATGCGGAAKQTKSDKPSYLAPAASSDEDEGRSQLTDEDFQLRQIEEVKAPLYLMGIEHEAQDLFRQGIMAAVSEPPRYELAEQKFRSAIDKDSKFKEAYFNLGMTLERLGRSDEALEVYKDAVDTTPDDVSGRAYIAKIYLTRAQQAALKGNQADEQKWLTTVKQLLDELVAQDHKNVAVNNSLALYWLAKGDLDQAETFVKEVLFEEPRDVTGLNTRGLINLKRGNFLVAEWIFKNKVLSEDPNSTEALTNLGYTYIQLDKRPLAMRYFKKALEQDPGNMEVRMNIGSLLLEHLNYQQAYDHYSRVFAAQPLNVEAHEGLCDATYGLGGSAADGKAQFQKGIDCYLDLLKKQPERHELYKRIADTYQQKLQDLDNAVRYLEIYMAKAELDEAEKKKTAGVIKVLKDIISKGGLKAMMAPPEPMDDEMEPMDGEMEPMDDEMEPMDEGEE